MLVLSRKKGESIKIGDDITVMVRSVRKDSVKLCIDAPKEIAIVRTELINPKAKGKKNAKSS